MTSLTKGLLGGWIKAALGISNQLVDCRKIGLAADRFAGGAAHGAEVATLPLPKNSAWLWL
jgi:hypothetical protein